MEMEQMVACPRCGSEPELEKIYDNTEITTAKCSNANCKHSSVTGLNEEMARKLWNIRAGDQKPAMPETVGVKALASATCSTEYAVEWCRPLRGEWNATNIRYATKEKAIMDALRREMDSKASITTRIIEITTTERVL
jgi:hypothetical protein